MTTGRINQVVELMLPRLQADSPKHIQLRCCHHNSNMVSETAAHIDNFECGVLETVLSTSVTFHTVSSACAQYYNEVSERGTSTLHRALSNRVGRCHINLDQGLLRGTLLTNVGMIRPAPKVIDHDQGEHQKHMHSSEDIASASALHIVRIRTNTCFAILFRTNCKCEHHWLWEICCETSARN